jgi:Leucine-rich repeat (LRR) protein
MTSVGDAGLNHLSGLTRLQELNLVETAVTGAGLLHLKGMTKLQSLRLDKTKVTDAGMAHLKGLTNLQELDLTDRDLVQLQRLTNLKELDLTGTGVTDTGVQRLRRALPKAVIIDSNGQSRPTADRSPVIVSNGA